MNTKVFGAVIIVISIIIFVIGLNKYNSVSKISYGNMSQSDQAIMNVLTNDELGRNRQQVSGNQETGKTIMIVSGLIFLVGGGFVISSTKK